MLDIVVRCIIKVKLCNGQPWAIWLHQGPSSRDDGLSEAVGFQRATTDGVGVCRPAPGGPCQPAEGPGVVCRDAGGRRPQPAPGQRRQRPNRAQRRKPGCKKTLRRPPVQLQQARQAGRQHNGHSSSQNQTQAVSTYRCGKSTNHSRYFFTLSLFL